MRGTGFWYGTVALLTLAGLALGCAEAGETGGETEVPDTAAAGTDTTVVTVADAGLETPESVLHDEQADVYLVSNINGGPLEKDDNGFIARIRPDGTVDSLRWIDGASQDVTLHAPKGLALKGDTLFVADIDSVRAFDRTTGAPLGARGVSGATFLNDLAIGGDGVLYVSDSGLDASFESTGTDAIHRFEAGQAIRVAGGSALASPNGIAVQGDEVLVAPFGAATLLRVPTGGGAPDTLATLPGGQLDGIVRTAEGDVLASSWETSTVYRVRQGGQPSAVVEGVQSPADIGYDAGRRRVLIPLFQQNRLEFHPVP